MFNKPSWSSWTLEEWNRFLVDAFLRAEDEESGPIYTFDASGDFLASKLPDDSKRSSSLPLDCFLAKYRRRHSFSGEPFALAGDWFDWTTDSASLPFFYQLYFSLIVASSTNETVEEGDFRKRLAKLLEIDHARESSIGLLPQMWKKAAKWTEEKISLGQNVRQLKLPDPGYETIIGHSKRLAFPHYLDRRKLVNLLYRHGLNSGSSATQLLKVVGSNINKFSSDFRSEYEGFRFAYERNSRSARNSPLWRVLQSISVIDLSTGRTQSDLRFSLELDLSNSPCSVDVVVNREAIIALNKKFVGELLPNSVGPLQYRLVGAIGQNFDESAAQALFALRRDFSSLVKGSFLVEQLDQGFLCFTQIDRFTWTPSRGLPENDEIDVCIVARGDLAQRVGTDLQRAPFQEIAQLKNWYCIGPIKTTRVAKLRRKLLYRDLAALRWSLSAPMVHLVEAVRLSDGVLFLPPVMPFVSAPEADSVKVRVKGTSQEYLMAPTERYGEFQFPSEVVFSLNLPKTVMVSAYKKDSLLGSRNENLIATCLSPNLCEPSAKSAWLEDSPFGQLQPWDNLGPEMAKTNAALTEAHLSKLIDMIQCDSFADLSVESSSFQFRPLCELPKRWSDVFESLVGKLTSKRGMAWREVVGLLEKASFKTPYTAGEAFEVLIQNGHLLRVVNRMWKGIRIFAAKPKAYIHNIDERTEITFKGLFSVSQRNAIQDFARNLDTSPEVAVYGDWETVGVIRVSTQSNVIDTDELLSYRIDVEKVPAEFTLPSPLELLSKTSLRTNIHSSGDQGYWNFNRSQFLPEKPRSSEVFLEEIKFDNARPCYALNYERSRVWTTESRTWALFVAHQMHTQQKGKRLGRNSIGFQTPVPMALSHLLLLFGPGVSGLKKSLTSQTWTYGTCELESFHRWLVDWGLTDRALHNNDAISYWIESMASNFSKMSRKSQDIFARRYSSK